MILELTKKEADDVILICISARHGLRGAAKKRREFGFDEHATKTEKLADFTETLSDKLCDLIKHEVG